MTLIMLSFAACSSGTVEEGTSDASSSEAVQGAEITILTPAEGETLSSPFNVTGTTDSPDTTIHMTSYGSDGLYNSESKWETESDGSFDFGSSYYFVGGGGEGTVEVYLLDADGNEYDRSVVPVMFE